MPLIELPDRLPDRFEDGYGHLNNQADMAGLVTIINDIFDHREPERFGTPEQRQALQDFVKTIGFNFTEARFWHALSDKMKQLGLNNPFEGISVAAVGCSAPSEYSYENQSTLMHAWSVIYGQCHFDTMYNFDGTNEYNKLTTAFSQEVLADGHSTKVDYLLTGNVLNDWDAVRDDTLLGCANMVKKGGLIVHMLNYGDARANNSVVDDPAIQAYAGQEHLRNVPEGKFGPYGGHTGTHMMLMRQKDEVAHTPESLQAFREAKASGKPITRFSAETADVSPADRTIRQR